MNLEIYKTEKIEGLTERERMKTFIAKWERILDHIQGAMGEEAIKNGWKIDGVYGGVHFSGNNKVMQSRIELKMIL